ncbi:MAG: hypothetical protein LBL99_00515, partial [Holosporaceae bacterium]|nr:hypothetical protein [Holosporaceae bacterium]
MMNKLKNRVDPSAASGLEDDEAAATFPLTPSSTPLWRHLSNLLTNVLIIFLILQNNVLQAYHPSLKML